MTTPKKLYYSIGEVAKMFGVNTSLIRFWEKEFAKWIKPHRSKSGSRYYTQEEIQGIKTIYQLVKIEGYTLQGAKEALDAARRRQQEQEEVVKVLKKAKATLQSILDEDKNNHTIN